MKKIKALILAGVMLLAVVAVSGCGGKECTRCGSRKLSGDMVEENFVCEACIEAELGM